MESFSQSKTWVRLLAFLLAIILWAVVRTGSDTNTTLPPAPSPIDRSTTTVTGTPEIQLDSNKMAIVGNIPELAVHISGERVAVLQVQVIAGKVKMTADAKGLGEGTHELPVKVTGLPAEVSYQPVTVTVQLEAIQQGTFPVELVQEGAQVADRREHIVVKPKEVTVIAPKSVLQQIKKVQARISPQIFDEPGVKQTANLQAVNENGKQVSATLQPKTAEITYEPPNSKKEFKKLQPEVKGLAPGQKVLLPAEGITLSLTGTPTALDAIKPEDIQLVLDVTGLPPGDYTKEVTVKVPATLKLESAVPIQIPIKIIQQ